MDMGGDVRLSLEKLFNISNGIVDPIAKLQFDSEAFKVVEEEYGYGLEALVKTREKDAREKQDNKLRADLDRLLQELREDLRVNGDANGVIERLLEVRKPYVQSEGEFRTRIMERLGGQLERYESYLWDRTGRRFAGLRQSILPTLNRNMNGLQGVTMVAGPTNSSKTQFFLHSVVSVVQENPDVSVLYFALDQPEQKLISRLCACITGTRVEDFEQGSTRDMQNPLTEEDWIDRQVGMEWLRENMGSRLFLFDRSYFPGLRVTYEDIQAAVKFVQKETGKQLVSIWVDYLDQLEVEGQEKMKDIYVDQQRIQCFLDYILMNPTHTVNAITEVNKESVKEGGPIKSTGVMGTSRKIYAPDNVIILNPMSDEEIMTWTDDYYGGDINSMALKINQKPVDWGEKEVKKKEFRVEAEKRREWLSNREIALGSVNLTKVRDGGKRCKVWYTNHFKCSRFKEGLSID